MNDLFLTLQFSWIPLLGILFLSLLLSLLGSIMTLRQEIISSLAFPQVTQGIASLWILTGIHIDQPFILLLLTLPMVYILFHWGQKIWQKKFHSLNLYYGLLLVFGGAITLLSNSLIWNGSNRLSKLLSGEIMALSLKELLLIIGVFLLINVIGLIYSQSWLSFLTDPNYLSWRHPQRTKNLLRLYQMIVVLGIGLGVVLVGHLITTSLLILPATFSLTQTFGLRRFLWLNSLITLLGTLLGFLLSIILDIPSVPIIILALIFIHYISNIILIKK